jgi:hypothetical protein
MAKVIINGKTVDVEGVSVEKLTEARPNGGYREGVSSFIKQVIDEVSKQGQAITISKLEKLVAFNFTERDKDGKMIKEFPEGQARVRINNLVRNSNGVYIKEWSEGGLRTVRRAVARSK